MKIVIFFYSTRIVPPMHKMSTPGVKSLSLDNFFYAQICLIMIVVIL